MVDATDGNSRDKIISLLQTLVRIDSCDPPGGELEIATLVHEHFQSVGIDSQLIEFRPNRANVVAKVSGQGNHPGLIFSAHFDTMPVGNQKWQYEPFKAEVINGRLYGRGAADMKSGMVAMIEATKNIAGQTSPLAGDLIVAFSAGESSSCIGAHHLVDSGLLKGAGAFLVSEPTSLNTLIAEKGALWLRATARGRTGHQSGEGNINGGGINAITIMKNFLNRLEEVKFDVPAHPLLTPPSISVGTIRGGDSVNVTPDTCVCEIDIRLLPGQRSELVVKQIQDIAGPEISIAPIDYKPAVETSPDHPFVKLCVKACEQELGNTHEPGGVSYYSDAAVICPALGLPMVILGPGELGMSGQCNEYVDIDNVIKASNIFTRIASQYLNDNA